MHSWHICSYRLSFKYSSRGWLNSFSLYKSLTEIFIFFKHIHFISFSWITHNLPYNNLKTVLHTYCSQTVVIKIYIHSHLSTRRKNPLQLYLTHISLFIFFFCSTHSSIFTSNTYLLPYSSYVMLCGKKVPWFHFSPWHNIVG